MTKISLELFSNSSKIVWERWHKHLSRVFRESLHKIFKDNISVEDRVKADDKFGVSKRCFLPSEISPVSWLRIWHFVPC